SEAAPTLNMPATGNAADPLARLGETRPRLMATGEAVERAREVLQRNVTAQRWQKLVTEQADLMLTLPPLHPDWVHDPRETAVAPLPTVRPPQSTDGDASRLDIARLFCLRIQTLGIIWMLTG